MQDLNVAEVINGIFESANLSAVMLGFKGLGTIALVIYLTKIIGEFLAGSQVITFSKLGPAIIYAAALGSWSYINSTIDDGMTVIQTSFEASVPIGNSMDQKYQEIVQKIQSIDPIEMEESDPENESTWKSLVPDFIQQKTVESANAIIDVYNIVKNPEIIVLRIVIFLTYILNAVIMLLFNVFCYIWLNLLRIGGILALALYFFPQAQGTFWNWLRTYVSVAFWIPVGSIMIYVSDQIFIRIVDKVTLPNGMMSDASYADNYGQIIIYAMACLTCLVLKMMLLSKVPTIISYWVGGGNTGDMFSGIPKSMSMATGAVTSTVGTAAGAAVTVASAGMGAGMGASMAAGGAASGGASSAGGMVGNSMKGDND